MRGGALDVVAVVVAVEAGGAACKRDFRVTPDLDS